MFNAPNMSAGALISQVQTTLLGIRNAMDAAEDLYKWSSAVSAADLTAAPPDGPGMRQEDAEALLSACADAHALADYYNVGVPPATYPQPALGYTYGASQRRVIGPRT